jgi:hypothetical protein
MKRAFFQSGKTLQYAIEHADGVPEVQDYLDANFAYLHFDLDHGSTPKWDDALYGAYFPIPYWIEEYPEDCQCQYVDGYYDGLEMETVVDIGGDTFRYVGSISLSEEMEHQAANGELVYEYRGPSFLRIYAPTTRE